MVLCEMWMRVLAQRGRDSVIAEGHALDRVIVGQHGHHHIRVARCLAGRIRHPRLFDRLCFRARPVVHRHVESGTHQIVCHTGTHSPKSNECELHASRVRAFR